MTYERPGPSPGFLLLKYNMATFITPYSGTAELTASNGLEIRESGRWLFSRQGYNDGATFGVSLGAPYIKGYYEEGQDTRDIGFQGGPGNYTSQTLDSGLLHLRAKNWTIAQIGNSLTDYTDPDTFITYPADRCRIEVRGQWIVQRYPNPNSYNSFGIGYKGTTVTDQGDRTMDPALLTLITGFATYIIQGSAVTGGAIDNFSDHEFFCRCQHITNSVNSNREYQSNAIARPVWSYTYTKSWQID